MSHGSRRLLGGPSQAMVIVALLRAAGLGLELTGSLLAGFPSRAVVAEALHAAPEVTSHFAQAIVYRRGKSPDRMIGAALLVAGGLAIASANGVLGVGHAAAPPGALMTATVAGALACDLTAAGVLAVAARRFLRRGLRFEALHIGAVDGLAKGAALAAVLALGVTRSVDAPVAYAIAALAATLAAPMLLDQVRRWMERRPALAWLVFQDDSDTTAP